MGICSLNKFLLIINKTDWEIRCTTAPTVLLFIVVVRFRAMSRPEHLNCINTVEGIHRINEDQRYYDEDPARYERQEQEAQEQYRMEQEEMRHQEQIQQDRHAEQQEQERMNW